MDFETIARSNHRNGMNCATAVYSALAEINTNKQHHPCRDQMAESVEQYWRQTTRYHRMLQGLYRRSEMLPVITMSMKVTASTDVVMADAIIDMDGIK